MREYLVPLPRELEARADAHSLLWLQKSATRRSWHVHRSLSQSRLASQWSRLLSLAAALAAWRSFSSHQHRNFFAIIPIFRPLPASPLVADPIQHRVCTSGAGSPKIRRGRDRWRATLRLVFFMATSPAFRRQLSRRALSTLSFCALSSLALSAERREGEQSATKILPTCPIYSSANNKTPCVISAGCIRGGTTETRHHDSQ